MEIFTTIYHNLPLLLKTFIFIGKFDQKLTNQELYQVDHFYKQLLSSFLFTGLLMRINDSNRLKMGRRRFLTTLPLTLFYKY